MATIRKRNSKYHVQIRRQGIPSQTKTFHQLKEAQEWARHMEVKADQGELPQKRTSLKSKTLADLVVLYKKEVTPTKRGSKAEECVLTAFLRNPICNIRLDKLTTADFARYRDERLQQVSPTTLKRQLNIIRHMFNIAKTEWDIPITVNPVHGLRLVAKDVRRERRLREGEFEKLIQAARTRRNPLIERIVIIAIETGMRRGEILGLHWDQVDLKRRSVAILESKNGYSRTIPLTTKAYETLQATPKADDRVFPLEADALRHAWKRMLRDTEMADLHFHDLRHEAISRLFEMGLTVPEVASISGHRDMKMLMRYAHADAKKLVLKLSRQTNEVQGP
ncbi:site-specific integrase [Labrenzia sp. VG12]|uniref:site-specific integrase n=1 Tax=Labrenzia sp. VG12 TaxID=2021862 RepID=UPI000B8C4C33|nr:site-specific integrase [Labrenzia sp. VG12]ASP35474.1 integrase [Labrenzia sp. VG12]